MSNTETIVFPDATMVVLDHLAATLPTFGSAASTHREIPDPRPALFIRVLRTGGTRYSLVSDGAQLTFEAWATTSAAAHDLAQLARGIVNAMPGTVIGGVAVYRVDELSGPGDLPDPVSNQQRYTWSAVVHLRGAAVEPD